MVKLSQLGEAYGSYQAFIDAGWTDELLIKWGYAVDPNASSKDAGGEPVAEVIEEIIPGTCIMARVVRFIGSRARPGDKLYAAPVHAAAAPVIHASFEVVSGALTGTTDAKVKRIERNDDDSYTVVIDHWPDDAAAPSATLESAERVIANLKGYIADLEAKLSAGAAAKTEQAPMEYRTCCDHPDCTTCAGRGGFFRLSVTVVGAGSEQQGACDACKGRGELFIAGVMGRCGLCKGAALARAPLPAQDGQAVDDARDAARYRFLRDPTWSERTYQEDGSCWVVQYHHPKGTIPELRSAGFGRKLDATVDAAMSASRPDDKGEKA